jgi:prepilin-type N-terminal cleavage/methylation domain-containing protein
VSRGFSLVEVIVAMTLLSIGLLGIAATGALSARMLSQAELSEDITLAAQNVLDSLITNNIRGAGAQRVRNVRLEWSASDHVVLVTTTLPGQQPYELRAAR